MPIRVFIANDFKKLGKVAAAKVTNPIHEGLSSI